MLANYLAESEIVNNNLSKLLITLPWFDYLNTVVL